MSYVIYKYRIYPTQEQAEQVISEVEEWKK